MKKTNLRLLMIPLILLLACSCPLTPLIPATVEPVEPTITPTNNLFQPTIAAPAVDPSGDVFSISFDDRSYFEQGLTQTGSLALAELPGASIYHVALSLASPPTSVLGMEQVRYTNTEDTPLDRVEFALFADILGGGIHVSDVRVDGETVSPELQTGVMSIPLTADLEPGSSIVISLTFEITVPTQGGNFYYGIFGYNSDILSLAHAIPTILVYNAEGWNDQIPDMDGDPLFVDTAFYVVSVDAPTNLVLVATGSEVQRSEANGRQQVLYADGPARDFYLAASAGLVKLSGEAQGVTVNSYIRPGEEQAGQVALDAGLASIQLFSDLYGEYPYTEFDITPIVTSAGGVEYPGLTVVALDNYDGYTDDWMELVVVHEVAHQWFYNLVGNDNQDQPWLDESLAEFLTWEYYRLHSGASAASSFETDERMWWQTADDPDLPIGMEVSAYSSYDYGAIVYGKGPFFWDALRNKMGQSAFNAMMRDYVATYSWDVATTEEFKALAEQHCGCDLTALFDEWIYPK